jgi:hypothetical protein
VEDVPSQMLKLMNAIHHRVAKIVPNIEETKMVIVVEEEE